AAAATPARRSRAARTRPAGPPTATRPGERRCCRPPPDGCASPSNRPPRIPAARPRPPALRSSRCPCTRSCRPTTSRPRGPEVIDRWFTATHGRALPRGPGRLPRHPRLRRLRDHRGLGRRPHRPRRPRLRTAPGRHRHRRRPHARRPHPPARPPPVLAALRPAHARGTPPAALCGGAFTLAQAGLLDGRRAITHWGLTDLLRAQHPRVRLVPDALFIEDGNIWTAAGTAAGID